jgi:hypothetical protein
MLKAQREGSKQEEGGRLRKKELKAECSKLKGKDQSGKKELIAECSKGQERKRSDGEKKGREFKA